MSHNVVSFVLASDDRFGAASIRCLHAATAALTAGLLAIEDPPVGVVVLADAAALLDDDAAVVLEVEAAGVEDAELDEEELLPHPPMMAATASSAESVLIMRETLVIDTDRFSVV